MGFTSFFQSTAESKELHTVTGLRSRYYKTNYQKAKAVVLEYAKQIRLNVRNIDDTHKEIFLQDNRYHVIVSLVQVNPIETSVDFKVEYYGIVGMNRPANKILEFYKYLDANLSFKGTSLHP
jgi:hypothetical protein